MFKACILIDLHFATEVCIRKYVFDDPVYYHHIFDHMHIQIKPISQTNATISQSRLFAILHCDARQLPVFITHPLLPSAILHARDG